MSAGGGRVVDYSDFPEVAKPEALAQIDVRTQLQSSTSDCDWFYLSPAAIFGAHAPGAPRGTYRLGDDVHLVEDGGPSAL